MLHIEKRTPVLSRRTFIKTGLLGGILLGGAWGFYQFTRPKEQSLLNQFSLELLDKEAAEIITKIAPAILLSELSERERSLMPPEKLVAAVEMVIAGFPEAVQKEILQLFNLLSLSPTRYLTTGIWSWRDATENDIEVFLQKWRSSSWQLFRSAYLALVKLIMAAWYGTDESWTEIGYPGPPKIQANMNTES